MNDREPSNRQSRNGSRRDWLRGAALTALGGGSAWLMWDTGRGGQRQGARGTEQGDGAGAPTEWVWQLDPNKCIACGNCATYCVLDESAAKCVHSFPMCGYCKLCTGFFEPDPMNLDAGAENQLCPTGAIIRKFVEDPYFEYHIDEQLCIGCGKCVKGCSTFGNGSLYLQVLHDRCVNCNECAIGVACPSDAFRRVPADRPYLLKTRQEST
ncbi:MAG: 4Fe-4S binding protein [Pirellulales bacterium]